MSYNDLSIEVLMPLIHDNPIFKTSWTANLILVIVSMSSIVGYSIHDHSKHEPRYVHSNNSISQNISCTLTQACNPMNIDVGCTRNRFLVFGQDGSGIGNQLVFFPAVYAFAITQGRQILLDDQTVIAKLCNLLEKCMYSTVFEAKSTHPGLDYDIQTARVVKLQDFDYFSKDNKFLLGARVVRAHGYLEDSSWWVHNKRFAECIGAISGSCYFCIADIAAKSLTSLLPGWFRDDVMSMYQSSAILPQRNTNSSMFFDVGIHLRNQLDHFEKSLNPQSTTALQTNIAYASSKLSKSLVLNIVQKIEQHFPINSTVYLSSDNEDIKDVLSHALLSKGFRVFRAISEGIRHSKSSKSLTPIPAINGLFDLFFETSKAVAHFADKKSFFHLLLDWKCLVLSNTVYAWRNVRPRNAVKFVSTFVKSTKLAGNKKQVFVLINAEKFDNSSRNWKSF